MPTGLEPGPRQEDANASDKREPPTLSIIHLFAYSSCDMSHDNTVLVYRKNKFIELLCEESYVFGSKPLPLHDQQ